jgi:adenine deaminase
VTITISVTLFFCDSLGRFKIKKTFYPERIDTLVHVYRYRKNYDLAINNGRVMEPETNFEAVANVGIKDDKIAVISSKVTIN